MQDKTKRKSDKIINQSMFLLDKIKQRKEKQTTIVINSNHLEDLYLQIFAKNTPHSSKDDTANSIFNYVRQKDKQCSRQKDTIYDLTTEIEDLRAQVFRLKDNKSEVQRMKTLNLEIETLQEKVRGLMAQAREERKEKDSFKEMHQNIKKENQILKSNNSELQELVQKLSRQLQGYLVSQDTNENIFSQLDQLRINNLELEKAIKSVTQQKDYFKDKLEQSAKIYEENIEKIRKSQTTIRIQAEQTEKEVQGLRQQLKKYKSEAKRLQKQLQIFSANMKSNTSNSTQLQGLRMINIQLQEQLQSISKHKYQLQEKLESTITIYEQKIQELRQNEAKMKIEAAETQKILEQLTQQLQNQYSEPQKIQQLDDDKIQFQIDKSNKHMQTIKELNSELTQAYSTISQLSKKLQQYEDNIKKQKAQQIGTKKKSPEPKDRGRSIKNMFGFK